MPAPLLIILPRGLAVSGVTTWAVGLTRELTGRGRRAVVLAEGGTGILPVEKRVGRSASGSASNCGREGSPGAVLPRHELEARATVDRLNGDLSPLLAQYRAAIDALAGEGPVVVSPNLHGDCYGAVVELARGRCDIRIVGWQHSDIPYDARMLAWYQEAIAAFVGVSGRIERGLRAALPARGADIERIPYGVEIPPARARDPLAGRPLRLLYAGRLDHEQKRVGALAPMMDALAAAGVRAELTIAGDGPARAEIKAMCARRADVRALGPVAPEHVGRLLDEADCFALPSRYEGLSVAMLEAMARGCAPIVARVDSGLDEAVRDGASGIIADVGPDAGADEAGRAMAAAVMRAMAVGVEWLGAGARAAAAEFSLARHVDRVEALLDRVAATRARRWPVDRPAAFSAWDDRYGSGSVRADGPARIARALDAFAEAGARIAIHGAGAHTRQLAPVIEPRLESIVCFCDDNPGAWGGDLMGRPVVAPGAAAEAGATHALISSWLHEQAIWRRRGVYERQGIEVVRLYAPEQRAVEAITR